MSLREWAIAHAHSGGVSREPLLLETGPGTSPWPGSLRGGTPLMGRRPSVELSPSRSMRVCSTPSRSDRPGRVRTAQRTRARREHGTGTGGMSPATGSRLAGPFATRERAAALAPGTWRMRPPGRTGPDPVVSVDCTRHRHDARSLDHREALNCRKAEGLFPCGRAALLALLPKVVQAAMPPCAWFY